MEWYFGNDMDDLAVPKDEEMFDRLPSPDSWSSWGKVVENFNSPKKLTILGVEEFLLGENLVSSDVERLSSQRVCQDSRHGFPLQRAYRHHHQNSDVQLNDLSIIDEADDIFFRSIFESDSSAIDGAGSPANFAQTSSKDDMMTIEHLGERDHIRDFVDDVENIGQLQTAKEMELETCFSEEHSDAFEDISEEDIFMEESVLVELQTLIVQLAKNTRVCFRDSLYRLAENSRHQTECSQNGQEGMENCKSTTSGEPSRLRKCQAKKLDTNAIDRTVATLLFNTMKCCNFPAASTSGLTTEMPDREYQANHWYESGFYDSKTLCTVQGGDAEVPTIGWTK